MVRKSYGKMRGTRYSFTGKRARITEKLASFREGDRVHIEYASHRAPHPRFQGLTGVVVGERGDAYIVAVKQGSAAKRLFLRPEHLKISK